MTTISYPDPNSQPESIKKWSEMSLETQDDHCAFSVYVAKRAGWTVEYVDDYIRIQSADGQQGKDFYNGHSLPGGIEQAWEMGYYHQVIPHYSTDANAALELISTLTSAIQHVGGRGYIVDLTDGRGVFSEFAHTATLAICKAWLAYTDAADSAGESEVGE